MTTKKKTTIPAKTKRKRSSPLLLRLAILLLLCTSFCFAAEKHKPYALIYGTVYAPDDSLAQGVRILIRQQDGKKRKYELISDRRGEFAQRVPLGPATYTVSIDRKSLVKGIKPGKDLAVKIERDERQDIALHLTR